MFQRIALETKRSGSPERRGVVGVGAPAGQAAGIEDILQSDRYDASGVALTAKTRQCFNTADIPDFLTNELDGSPGDGRPIYEMSKHRTAPDAPQIFPRSVRLADVHNAVLLAIDEVLCVEPEPDTTKPLHF